MEILGPLYDYYVQFLITLVSAGDLSPFEKIARISDEILELQEYP